MALAAHVDRSLNQLLVVEPFYGWGWSRGVAGSGKAERADVPDPFRMRLRRLWNWQGELRGGVGRIEEPGHRLDGHWVIFSTRHEGTFDFDEQLGQYNVTVAPLEPTVSNDGWPVVPGEGWTGSDGYAEIRAA